MMYAAQQVLLVKIATFNINDINKRLENLLTWLAKAKPDVVCLQELKAETTAFPAQALRNLGYEAVWEGERSWNGVAILSRSRSPVLTRSTWPGKSEDRKDFGSFSYSATSRRRIVSPFRASLIAWFSSGVPP
jgi:exonuclease III